MLSIKREEACVLLHHYKWWVCYVSAPLNFISEASKLLKTFVMAFIHIKLYSSNIQATQIKWYSMSISLNTRVSYNRWCGLFLICNHFLGACWPLFLMLKIASMKHKIEPVNNPSNTLSNGQRMYCMLIVAVIFYFSIDLHLYMRLQNWKLLSLQIWAY